MSVQDIIKKSFLEQFNTSLSTTTIMTALLFTVILAVYIFVIYRIVCRKAFYSKSFAISLVVIAMITATVIMTVQTSVVISLGMVGALSIVRFRTAIKDPMDLAFLFWSISIGIICGANLFEVAVEGSVLIAIVMLLLHFVPNVRPTLLLVVNAADSDVEDELNNVLKGYTRHYRIKSRSISSTGMNMLIELQTKQEAELLRKISQIKVVNNATIMTHEGEITY